VVRFIAQQLLAGDDSRTENFIFRSGNLRINAY